MERLALLVIPACLVLLSACSKPQNPELSASSASPSPMTAQPESAHQIDACSLLTSEEIQSVQTDTVTGTTPSGGTLSGFPSTQCLFQTATPANSVSVVVTQSTASRHVTDFWKETFHREESEKESATTSEEGEEKKEKKTPPQPVGDLGDDAFLIGTQVSSALYVLKSDSYIRISVGGAGDQAAKLEKSRKLAEFALKRL